MLTVMSPSGLADCLQKFHSKYVLRCCFTTSHRLKFMDDDPLYVKSFEQEDSFLFLKKYHSDLTSAPAANNLSQMEAKASCYCCQCSKFSSLENLEKLIVRRKLNSTLQFYKTRNYCTSKND